MPIDPRIPLMVDAPATVDVTQTMGRGLALRDAFEQAKANAQQRADNQAAQQTIAQSGGNLDTAIQTLYQRGLARPAMALEAVKAKRQKDASDLLKTTLGNEAARYDVVSKAANGITDQATQDATIARLKTTDPQTADVMAQTLGPTYNPDNVTKAQTISLNAKESADMKHQAAIAYQESQKTAQDGVKFLSSMLAGTPPEHWDTVYQHAPSFVGPDVIKTVQGMVQTPDQAKALAIGPEKQAELTNQQAIGVRADAREERMAAAQQQQLGMERQRLGLEGARVGLEAKRAKDETVTPNDILGMTHTTLSGKRYLDMNDFEGMKEKAAARHAAQAAGLTAVDAKTGASLKAIDSAKQNAQEMWRQVSGVLPKDASGRIIAGPENTLARIFQTNPQLGAFGAWRTAAIQQVQALAEPGMGLRINQAEIKAAMDNDIPQETDTVQVAAQRLKNLFTMLGNKENDALTMDRSTLVQGATAAPSKNPFRK